MPMTFTKTILAWYEQNHRDLPWRRTRDPYIIWISEIILQQTRVGQGLKYFYRFVEQFPTLEELAGADEIEVLKAWQGLGYYSRARNLHAAAKEITDNHNGIFPDSYDKLVILKGIGQYTAAAIASIAFNHPHPVVDGNVSRFLSRYFGIGIPVDKLAGKNMIYEKALLLIDRKQPGMFNQAIMEFGALQCRPGKPDCKICPLQKNCCAFIKGNVELFPVKSTPKKQRKRYFHYFVIISEKENKKKYIYLRKREKKDIWENLYDFPLIETNRKISEKKLVSSSEWKEITGNGEFHMTYKSHLFKHILTHQVIFARFYVIQQAGRVKPKPPYLLVSMEEIKNYPVPRLIEQFFNETMISF